VDLNNIRDSPIVEITEKGIKTAKEGLVEFDIIVIATGFDSLTGIFTNIDIKNARGECLKEHWKREDTSAYLGFGTAGFPNLWYMYGPQGPTPLGNAVTVIEIQGEWLVELIVRMRQQDVQSVDAKTEGEVNWRRDMIEAREATLLPNADSWYQGP